MTRSKSNPGMWRSSNGRYGVSSDEEVESSSGEEDPSPGGRYVGRCGVWSATAAIPSPPGGRYVGRCDSCPATAAIPSPAFSFSSSSLWAAAPAGRLREDDPAWFDQDISSLLTPTFHKCWLTIVRSTMINAKTTIMTLSSRVEFSWSSFSVSSCSPLAAEIAAANVSSFNAAAAACFLNAYAFSFFFKNLLFFLLMLFRLWYLNQVHLLLQVPDSFWS